MEQCQSQVPQCNPQPHNSSYSPIVLQEELIGSWLLRWWTTGLSDCEAGSRANKLGNYPVKSHGNVRRMKNWPFLAGVSWCFSWKNMPAWKGGVYLAHRTQHFKRIWSLFFVPQWRWQYYQYPFVSDVFYFQYFMMKQLIFLWAKQWMNILEGCLI